MRNPQPYGLSQLTILPAQGARSVHLLKSHPGLQCFEHYVLWVGVGAVLGERQDLSIRGTIKAESVLKHNPSLVTFERIFLPTFERRVTLCKHSVINNNNNNNNNI